jgi:tetratricopeptide (TPR) repeat protein
MTETMESYYKDLQDYYKLKNNYQALKQKKINELIGLATYGKDGDVKKKSFAKFRAKCINCKQDGGTLFTETSDLLRATCGNSVQPCKLDLAIKRKKFVHITEKMGYVKQELEKYKKNIITTKLDFLFNYIEEDKAIEMFELLKQQLNNSQENYLNLLTLYNSIMYNEEMKTLIQEKTLDFENNKKLHSEALELYKSSGQIMYLKNAMEIYKTKLSLLGNEIMKLKYKTSHIEHNEQDQYILFQNNHNLEDLMLELND